MMPEVAVKNLSDILYKTLSIRVPCCSDNLVGNVIFGKKLSVIIESRYSLIIGLFPIFSESML